MLKAKYEKEGMQQYLSICCDEKFTTGYANQLMQYHTIPFFISYEIRELNDSCELFYCLKYRTTLSSALEHLVLDYSRVKEIISSIIGVLETAENYFLSPDQILWKSQYIFMDSDTGKLQFCYYPDFQTTIHEKGDLNQLLAMIIQSIDIKEKEARLLITEFYHYVMCEDCTVDKLIHFMEGENYGNKKMQEANNDLDDYDKRTNGQNIKNKRNKKREIEEVSEKKRTAIMEVIVRGIIIVLAIINIIGIILILVDRFPYTYTGYLIGTMAAMIIATIVYMNVEKEESLDNTMQNYFEEMDQEVKIEAVISDKKESSEEKSEGKKCGETSMLICEDLDPMNEIVTEEKGERYILSPFIKNQYPEVPIDSCIVIGRMRAGCNYILKEKDISRMHAKIVCKTDGVYVIDLNSKNGSYVNGERIISGEEVQVGIGDALCFANCEFYLRDGNVV